MTVPPSPDSPPDQAATKFYSPTARLITQILPVDQVFFWGQDDQVCYGSPPSGDAEGTLRARQTLQRFLYHHDHLLRQGVPGLTDLHLHQWQPWPPTDSPNPDFSWLILSAHHHQTYLGGLAIHLTAPLDAGHGPLMDSLLDQYIHWCYDNFTRPSAPLDNLTALNLSHIHHELRTPLTGILGFAKLLRDELYGTLNPKQHQYVQGILNSADYLLSLVNDFLDLSKLDAQCEDLFWEWVAVKDLCLAVVSMVQPRAKERGLALTLTINDGVDICWLDQRRWKQILINLLSNAIKFTPTGSITLTVSRRENWLVFAVVDTGIGIPPEELPGLFQPFKQVNHALNRQHKGTGLGLALSRKLARLHGGDIHCHSVAGQGSCFEALLPLQKNRP